MTFIFADFDTFGVSMEKFILMVPIPPAVYLNNISHSVVSISIVAIFAPSASVNEPPLILAFR